jgi:hypothetical protein
MRRIVADFFLCSLANVIAQVVSSRYLNRYPVAPLAFVSIFG